MFLEHLQGVLSAIGNNHSGTYYPVVLEVLNFIIAFPYMEIMIRNCAINILIELFWGRYGFNKIGVFEKIRTRSE